MAEKNCGTPLFVGDCEARPQKARRTPRCYSSETSFWKRLGEGRLRAAAQGCLKCVWSGPPKRSAPKRQTTGYRSFPQKIARQLLDGAGGLRA